ncbi:hypothetical protein C8J55DRAFT_495622 [Lentinula edodes]|uniref:Uncharacterized protein n=1 Tax=Lentinula lateritia TaxID=40482 RepID=A0A9W9B1J8_9AGAR|nr:hypothetical protein C8J55DRAFT_495622 [Lentinula edodes]
MIRTANDSESSILSQYLAYPFDSDANFKKGLSDIVSLAGTNRSTDIPEDTIRSMRVFYFNRLLGHSLSVAEVQAYEQSKNSTRDISTSAQASTSHIGVEANDAEPLSFAQIQALIEAGRMDEIPNNKTICTDLNSASLTTSPTVLPRKKPWENEVDLFPS